MFENCASCHRPGESGPFLLLSYNDVKKRARQIAEVTEKRYMPPWLPDGPADQFVGDRRLSREQVELFRRWYDAGTPEGAGDLPAMPHWPEGWHLGQPDLVVEMPKAFELPAEGRDVYRNFVVPAPLSQPRYVRAVEFRPIIVESCTTRSSKWTPGSGSSIGRRGWPGGLPGHEPPDGVKMPSGYFELPARKNSVVEPPAMVDPQARTRFNPANPPETNRPARTLQAQVGLFSRHPPTNVTLVHPQLVEY